MGKVILKRLIRHFVNGFVKIPAKFFRAERKKEKLYSRLISENPNPAQPEPNRREASGKSRLGFPA